MSARTVDDLALREVVTTWPEFELLDVSEVGLRQTYFTWGLGHVEIGKRHPSARFGYSYPLTATSRFRAVPFRFDDLGAAGTAAVFRLADGPDEATADEYVAAWVRSGFEAELDGWLAFLDGEITARLAEAAAMAPAAAVLARFTGEGGELDLPGMAVTTGEDRRLLLHIVRDELREPTTDTRMVAAVVALAPDDLDDVLRTAMAIPHFVGIAAAVAYHDRSGDDAALHALLSIEQRADDGGSHLLARQELDRLRGV